MSVCFNVYNEFDIYMALKEFKITIVTKCCGTPFDARQLYVRNAKGHKNYANKLLVGVMSDQPH